MSKDVGSLIRAARERAGLSPAELARLIGRNPSAVSRWERNQGRPSEEAPQRLVEVLGLNPDEFYRALGATPEPVAAFDVESAVRADPHLSAGEKAQVLNLYSFFRGAPRDKHDAHAADAFTRWEAAEPVRDVSTSSHTDPGP